MRRLVILAVLCLTVILVTGCLAGPNDSANMADEGGEIAGFWKGLWHGIIAPLTFILSLFSDSIHFYEVNNNGNWYNLGFVIGAGILFGGGNRATRRRRRNT